MAVGADPAAIDRLAGTQPPGRPRPEPVQADRVDDRQGEPADGVGNRDISGIVDSAVRVPDSIAAHI